MHVFLRIRMQEVRDAEVTERDIIFYNKVYALVEGSINLLVIISKLEKLYLVQA